MAVLALSLYWTVFVKKQRMGQRYAEVSKIVTPYTKADI